MSTMNSILEKFMFNKNSENARTSKGLNSNLGLSPSQTRIHDNNKGDASPNIIVDGVHHSKGKDQNSSLMKQIHLANDSLQSLHMIREESDIDLFRSQLLSLYETVDAALSQMDKEPSSLHSLWKLSLDIWNTAVVCDQKNGLENGKEGGDDDSPPETTASTNTCSLHQLSCQIALEVFPDLVKTGYVNNGEMEINLSLWRRLVKTGELWALADKNERAEFCFSNASKTLALMNHMMEDESIAIHKREEALLLLVSLHCRRGAAAIKLKQNILLSNLLGKCKEASNSVPYDFTPVTRYNVAEVLFTFGEFLLSWKEGCTPEEDRGAPQEEDSKKYSFPYTLEAIKILDCATEVIGDETSIAETESEPDISVTTKNLQIRILKNLAHAHLKAKNFSAAQSVLTFLKPKLNPDIGKHQSFHIMSIQTALGLEKYEEAMSILGDPMLLKDDSSDSSALIHFRKFKICYQDSRHNQHSKIASLFVDFCSQSGNASQVIDFLCFLLSSAEEAEISRDYQSAVEIASDPKVTELFQKGEEQACHRVYGILYNSGVTRFKSQDLDLAKKLFQTCLIYVSLKETDESRGNTAKLLRCLALVFCLQEESNKALEHLSLAKEIEPGNVLNDWIAIRIHLANSDHSKCTDSIKQIMQSSEIDPNMLLSICREARQSKQQGIACECLLKFYEHQKKLMESKDATVPLSTVLRCLITLAEEGDQETRKQIPRYLKEAHLQFTSDNKASHLLKDCDISETAHFFAVKAWNLGVKANKDEQYGVASSMFEVSGSFFEPLEDQQEKVSESFFYASLLHLEACKLDPRITTSKDPESSSSSLSGTARLRMLVKRLTSHLARNKDVLKEDLRRKINKTIPWLEYQIACHNNNVEGALQLLTELKQICDDPTTFVQMANSASLLKCKSKIVMKSALHVALQCFQNALPLHYPGMALCLRTLIDERSNDEEGIGLSSQALEIVRGLPSKTYPADEIQWLCTEAWNRGIQLFELGSTALGARWLKVGFAFLPHCPELEYKRAEMDKFMNATVMEGGGCSNSKTAEREPTTKFTAMEVDAS